MNTEILKGQHDLTLPAWGPYTKRYMGVSHIPDPAAGLRFDLSVFPGLYRRFACVPNVRGECGYHPWEASPDLSYFCHRHEIEWKDRVYTDIGFAQIDPHTVLLRARNVNTTPEPRNLVLHLMASMHFPPPGPYTTTPAERMRPVLPSGAIWIDALDYRDFEHAHVHPQDSLTPDGLRWGEIGGHGLTGSGAVRFRQNDTVTLSFSNTASFENAIAIVRVRLDQGHAANIAFSGSCTGHAALSGSGNFELVGVPLGAVRPGDIRITCDGAARVDLDGFALADAAQAADVTVSPAPWQHQPVETIIDDHSLMLRYEGAPGWYGIAWEAASFQVREFLCDDLDTTIRETMHNHTSATLRGPGTGHYTNVFIRPIFLDANASTDCYGLVCHGDRDPVQAALQAFANDDSRQARFEAARARAIALPATPAGAPYRVSQERMAATVLTNVVYPVRTRGTWIRHATPGRWWDCLYTWDSGFIGLGLAQLDPDRAIENLNAYLTPPGEKDAAFIHHGTPVPVQFYLFQEIWNRTHERELLAYFYPRLQQYHRFLAGRAGSSSTRALPSNLLTTWDYFYNSGGWDDYPPQQFVHQHGDAKRTAPSVTNAHVIRTARMLRWMARELGRPTNEYDNDIRLLAQALQDHAWDAEAGCFSYVVHDEAGNPREFLRHESGVNFNLGMDGVMPLIAGICTPEQEERLVERLMNPEGMWTPYGLTTVDRRAPYFRHDGYWNGAVWMPHQWFFWKALLDLGHGDAAHRVAATALDVWKHEVESSYNCFEHFIVGTGRGAGWHHFGGLSSPVLCWYTAYHRPGNLTAGLDVWITDTRFNSDHTRLEAELSVDTDERKRPLVIATMNPLGGAYRVSLDNAPVDAVERYPGIFEIPLPGGNRTARLRIASTKSAGPKTTEERHEARAS